MKKPLILVFLISLVVLGACGRKAKIRNNTILAPWEGLYGLPPFSKVEAKDFAPAFDEALKQHQEEIELIKASEEAPDFENVIVALDSCGTLLERVYSVYALMAAVDSSALYREMEEDIAQRLTTHRDMILHDAELFDKVAAVYYTREKAGLDPVQSRLVERTYDMFVRGGAMLEEKDKDALRTINAGLAKRETAFGRHITRASKESYILVDSAGIMGLSYALRDSTRRMAVAAGADSLFLFLLDEPLVTPALTTSTVAPFRQRLYTAYRDRCEEGDANDNRTLINEIVGLRDEKARLLGFDSYSAYADREGMPEGRAGIYSMLDEIWGHALDKAAKEEESRRQLPGVDNTGVLPWDMPFYDDRLMSQETGMDRTKMEVFFSVDNVRVGAFELANRLWGLTFRPVQLDLYNSDCEAFEVFDIDGSLMGLFVLDYYSRVGKKPGTGIYPLSYRAPEGSEDPVPVVCMVFNLMHQGSARPAMLSDREIDMLFRAVGNSVGRLFVDAPYRGLRTMDRDMEGLAGELMCCWAFQPQMLSRYAMHYSSGNLPVESDIRHIASVPAMFSGSRTVAHAAAAYMDMDVHSPGAAFTNQDTFELEYLREKRGMPRSIDPVCRLSAFGEVFGQDAGAQYYTSLWSGVLAADIFGRFAAGGNIFDRRIAGELRDKVLSKGGSAPAAELYRDFMGRDASLDAFLVAKGFVDPPPAPARPAWELYEYPADEADSTGVSVSEGSAVDTPVRTETEDRKVARER